jgi:hypothetical protein
VSQTFTVPNVRLLRASDVNWCCVNGRTVLIAARHLQAGTTVSRTGDHGRLVIASWLARDLGLLGDEL